MSVAVASPAPEAAAPAGRRRGGRRTAIRALVVTNLVLATNYLAWRWSSSINWQAWLIAVPLVVAETYSYVDSWLFGLTMWRVRERGAAPPPPAGATVDVFITTYDEPVELVRVTARAARALRGAHETYVLDDGARDEMRRMADEEGVGYVTRSPDWTDRPRHAKAGNLNNALLETSGEFLLILDADQVPDPALLERTLGWFRDPGVALVQTPQWFTNVTSGDPLGSQAPLFYGPIQQGKDGWNAAFFCGSNAVLRREALMQAGIVGYVGNVERTLARVLDRSAPELRRARAAAVLRGNDAAARAIDELQETLREMRRRRSQGEPALEITHAFRVAVDAISRRLVASDAAAWQADLAELQAGGEAGREAAVDHAALDRLAGRELSPLGAIAAIRGLLTEMDAVRDDEAQPVMPMATISVTEDMATAMRLHALGWRSVYHHEVLAHGLAPEDLGSMLQQRLRWAQGTLQVMLRENPLVQRGLSAGQRLMYFATMWSYLSGFAALAYLLAPVLYLTAGVKPVTTFGGAFVWHIVPFLVVNQLLFAVVGWGRRTWRGQQYSLALFPLWIRACITTAGNVLLRRELGFVVTPKTRQEGVSLGLVRVQLAAMGLLVGAAVAGIARYASGAATSLTALVVNLVWVAYDLVALSVIIEAARYQGYEPEVPGT